MKRSKVLIVALLASLSVSVGYAQTVDEIIGKYFENTGGKQKWEALQGLKMTAKMNMQGMDLPLDIVQLKDGMIGIFETKQGITAKDATERAEALQKYIKKQNKNGKNLKGGIAIYVNGTWRYNDSEKYQYNPSDLSSWKILDL